MDINPTKIKLHSTIKQSMKLLSHRYEAGISVLETRLINLREHVSVVND